ncbi:DUF305 domain-containing protein [Caenorhabditis elegans]|uniref:DUF305 domain-containing protein n=1 Tax=Caenorhabditis elegans TaxID=6239 RepID=H2L2H9_CAEEL|nr:DUF305 domain-containing protein [Caenorhabditis elegans]CCE71565.1 DUF305 domain-containing protein [Caenorhabditis elegans]|eukprot:NP_001256928.1 Uncharacterized protein CELE_F26F2.13 [Caenorhabditis elegans]
MSDNNTLRMAEMLDKQNSQQNDFMKFMMEMNNSARLSDQARDDRNAIRSENNLKEVYNKLVEAQKKESPVDISIKIRR